MLSRRFHAVLRRVLRPAPPPSSPPPPTHPLPFSSKTLPLLSVRGGSTSSPSPPPSPFARFAASAADALYPGRWPPAWMPDPRVTNRPPPSAPPPPPPPPPSWPRRSPYAPPPPPPYGPPSCPRRSPYAPPLTSRTHWRRTTVPRWSRTAFSRHYSSEAEKPNPFKVTWREAKSYLAAVECPTLLVKVPDRASQLYNLVKENQHQPRMLSEIGKVMVRSLIMVVLRCHDEKLCLGKGLVIENLVMSSSLGTLQFKKFESTEFTEKGREADLATVSDLIVSILELCHGPGATSSLPSDLSILLVKMKNPRTPRYIIENHPSLLSAATYGAAFLKLYEHIVERLGRTDYMAAYFIARDRNPYRWTWIKIAQSNNMLKAFQVTSSTHSPFHHIKFGRTIFCHPQEKNVHAVMELGVSDYTLESASILFQHSYPELLPVLQEELWEHYAKKSALDVMDTLHFGDLFSTIPAWAVSLQ